MKKITLCTISILISISTFGQIIDLMNAAGLRLSYNQGLTGEVNYQRYLNKHRQFRFESGLSYRNVSDEPTAIKLVSTFQYVKPVFGDYRVYAGIGPGIGNYNTNTLKSNEFILSGIIGIQWSNIIPLMFSLDVRPEYRPTSIFNSNVYLDVGLSLRLEF